MIFASCSILLCKSLYTCIKILEILVLNFPQPVSNASDQFLGLSQAIYLRSFILANIAVIISG